MTVTFFGHRSVPPFIQTNLERTVRHLIEHKNADVFYVGNNGDFDAYATNALKKLTLEYPHIKYYIVLAYMPRKSNQINGNIDYNNTILPEKIAQSIPKFAISKRNDWMLNKSDLVITYITHTYGGAEKYQEKAIKQGKMVINIAKNQ